MKATETQLRILLEGQRQFQIPLFQRRYRWTRENWEVLWNDILEIRHDEGQPHFIGSTVMKQHDSTAEGVTINLVIDGQQRLTTISLLLAAIRDQAGEGGHKDIAEKIHDLYLTNRHARGQHHYKVVPTQDDRDPYFDVINEEPPEKGCADISDAYWYFRKAIEEELALKPEEDMQPLKLSEIMRLVTQHIELVSITLAEADNEYRIFESLNAKGEPLTQADLIRNHIFMRLSPERQEQAYHEYWLPTERALGEYLEDYFRHQIMSEGEYVKSSNIYQHWKTRLVDLNKKELEEELQRIRDESRLYQHLINPATEPNQGVSRRLKRINQWRGKTVYPFLLNVYRCFKDGTLSAKGFESILQIIESFMVRRFFCGIPTNALNRLFNRLYVQLPHEGSLVEETHYALSDPDKRWPTDRRFKEALINFPLYSNGKPAQRRLILDTLAQELNGKEPVDLSTLSIEHIMPQTPTPEWEKMLKDEKEEAYESWLHRLGNLTLTGYNSELSNSPFATKREHLASSSLKMNRDIAEATEWTPRQMRKRVEKLASCAMEIWPGPVEYE